MRLGFWNRLALVAGVLLTFGIPSWWVLGTNADNQAIFQREYHSCVNQLAERLEPEAVPYCSSQWLEGAPYLDWNTWLEAVATMAGVVVIAYLLIASAAWIYKWVMAGRG